MSSTPARIGIIGLGAIGSVVASYLLDKGNDALYFFTRTAKTEISIERDGIKYVHELTCSIVEHFEEQLDWVIICLKAHHFTEAQDLFAKLIGKQTKVAIIRNGINLEKDLLTFTSSQNILPCMIDCPVQPKEDGSYLQFKDPKITVPWSILAEEFEHLLLTTSTRFIQSDDFKTDSWKKLIESSAIGTLQCIERDTCRIFHNQSTLHKFEDLVKESIRVAQAAGAKIEDHFKDHLVEKVLTYPIDKGSSMLTDLKDGKPLELEAKNGAIMNVAIAIGMEVPLNTHYYTDLLTLNT